MPGYKCPTRFLQMVCRHRLSEFDSCVKSAVEFNRPTTRSALRSGSSHAKIHMTLDPAAQFAAAIDVIRSRFEPQLRVGIVLGSGLSGLANAIDIFAAIDGDEIPGYPRATVIGHNGKVLCGLLSDVPVIAIDGRPHNYEGHSFADVAYPTRLMIELGIDLLLLSNASGAVNPNYHVGDVMIVEDHINLMWGNPLIGPNRDDIGPRFPDVSAPYDSQLIDLAHELSRDAPVGIRQGVYMAMAGPSYETRAEYRMARVLGADVVGMSTVPEVLVARHAGIRCAAFSVVSNVFDPNALVGSTGEEIVRVVAHSEPVVRKIVQGIVARENVAIRSE